MATYKVEICGVTTSKLPILSNTKKHELLIKIKNGDEEARNEFINGNLRLVLSVIRKFYTRGENLDDLFQVGCVGLIKALNTNRTNTEIVRNYSKIVLKNRLDVLLSPNTRSYQEYVEIAKYYTEILQTANKFYDFVFVDLSKRMPPKEVTEILQTSDIIVMNLTQRLRTIDDFIALRENSEFYRRKNIILNIGRYDKFSKYNDKNITKYLREKQQVSVVPYNTLFFEACTEGTVIDLLLKLRSITDDTDRNVMFVKELKNLDNNIIVKMQELQMKK